MPTSQLIVMCILGLAIAAGNIWFWYRVIRSGDAKWRARVERRYKVTITTGFRGHWKVISDRHSAAQRFAIELLQGGYFVGLMLLWGVAMVLAVGLMSLVEKLW